ncbi:MAG TPA: ATP-binding protein, partial [Burkholderiaceae bacterium]|nr:ATP-binding protein [Burkholderiaceae bacterium]
KGAPQGTWEERHMALERYVYAAFRMEDLMRGIYSRPDMTVRLEVFDGQSTSPEALLYAGARPPGMDEAQYPNPYTGTAMLLVGDAVWTLRLTSLPAFERAIDRDKGLIVLISGMLISLLFFSVVRALTANRAEALELAMASTSALRQSERKFGALVESAIGFSIISTDLAGVIQVFSPGAERMLGYAAGEMVGRQTPAILHVAGEVARRGGELTQQYGRTIAGFDVFVTLARMGIPETREWTYVRKDGSTLPVLLTVTAITGEGGAVTGFLGIANDITEQKQAEAALLAAKLRADAASDAKSEFVANMSHELRTPLNAVLGLAELLAQTPLNVEQHKDLGMLRKSGKTLLGILNDILDFSKIEAGRMELSVAPFAVDELLATVAMMMGASASAGGNDIELVIDVDPATPALLVGDALRLQQVLVNLAGNAIKFTPRGSVSVALYSTVGADGMAALRFVVRDTGIGMSGEQVGRLFMPFTQADSSMTRRFGGTGLGLAISRRLIELMGGTITVASRPDEGSVFMVALTLPQATRAVAPCDAGPGREVLLIAPQSLSRQALRHAVWRAGWHASEAGEPVLAWLRADGPPPPLPPLDVVVLDWRICAGGTAAATVQRLRGQGAVLVILLVSCPQRARMGADAWQLGFDGVLDEPATTASLVACVQEAGRRRATAGQATQVAAAGEQFQGHVLLVEDNDTNQYIARAMLAGLGLTVECADDGRQAVELLRARPADFQLVLMDVQMPVMDGFAATGTIRTELGLRLPVIAMTAGVMATERDRCTAAGMDDFIGKPVESEQLRTVLARYLAPKDGVAAGPGAGVAEPAAPAAAETAAMGDGVFDLRPLLDAIGSYPGHLETMRQMVGQFVDAGTAAIDGARLAWQEGHRAEAAATLHTARGSIGALGARRFVSASLALEGALRDGDDGLAAALFAPVKTALQATLAAAAAWLAGGGPAAGKADGAPPAGGTDGGPAAGGTDGGRAAGGTDGAPADDTLALFRQRLAERNMAAMAIYDTLRPSLSRMLGAARAEALDAALNQFDFDAALLLLAT